MNALEKLKVTFLNVAMPQGWFAERRKIRALQQVGCVGLTDNKALVVTRDNGNLDVIAKPLFSIDRNGLSSPAKFDEIAMVSKDLPNERIMKAAMLGVAEVQRGGDLMVDEFSLLEVENPDVQDGAKYILVREGQTIFSGKPKTSIRATAITADGEVVHSQSHAVITDTAKIAKHAYPASSVQNSLTLRAA